MKMTRHWVLVILALFVLGAAASPRPFALGRVRVTGGVFKEKQDIDREYLLDYMTQHRVDKLLAEFRRVAGLPEKAKRYEGRWEGGGINGHTLGHYLTAVAACYAATGDERAKERVDYIVDELAACQEANGDGYVMTIPQREVWDKVRSGDFKVGGFSIADWWVPNYTIHKVFAGLRDAYRWAGNAKALEVARKLADWYIGVIGGLTDEQMQKLLRSEWGGLNETFADLAADTGDRKYLDVAIEKFDHREIFDPLRHGADRLDGKHANTQMPKITGLATIYDMTGDKGAKKAVMTYWDSVVNKRTLANGGHSDREHFYPMTNVVDHLGPQSFETCNINNMHRLASHIFCWSPDPAIADFVERSLINQLVAQIGEKPGEFGYFLSTRPVAEKVFSAPEGAWWCCVGTGMENPMRYGEQAYFHDDDGVWVNLYLASTLDWREKGVKIEQLTTFPDSEDVTIKIHTAKPVKFDLRLRVPSWCNGMTTELHPAKGSPESNSDASSGYMTFCRTWNDGDEVAIHLPMQWRVEPLPNSNGRYAAFMKGPLVMVGITPPETGVEDMAKKRWKDHLAAPAGTDEIAQWLVTEDLAKETAPTTLRPNALKFMPLHKVYEEHYTMYFPVLSPREYEEEHKRLEEEARLAAEMRKLVTDEVEPGFQQSEVNHDFVGEYSVVGELRGRKWRDARGKDGKVQYTLAVDPEKPMQLEIVVFGANLKRTYDIRIDGTIIASEPCDLPHCKRPPRDKFTTRVYPIPQELTRGKQKVDVSFTGNEKTDYVGGFYGITMRRQP